MTTTTPTSSPPSPSDDDPGPTTERSCSDVADRLSSSIGLAATDSKTTARLRSMREEGRAASVLVLVSSDLHVLLTLRSAKLNSHPSQVSFPGGRQDPSDGGDDVVTALRETKEEVGLDYTASWKPGGDSGGGDDSGEVGETGLRIVCRMPSTEALGRLCVTPIVAVHTSKTWRELHGELTVNDDEVATAFWAPLGFVLDDEKGHNEYLRECHEVPDWPVPGVSFVYRAYDYDSFPLVAAPPRDAAMLLSGSSSSSHHAKPVFAVTGLTANILLEVAGAAYGTTTARPDSAPGGVDVVRNASVSNFERKGNYGGDGEGEEEEEGDGDGDDGPILRGLMLRRVDRDSANGGSSWVEGCFALTATTGGGGMIHHYDSVEDALRRRQSARKKNRLRLAANTRLDASLTAVDLVDDDDGDPKTDRPSSEKFRFVFRISTLGGRLDWDLAASSPEERTLWMKRIESLVNAGRGSSTSTAPSPPPPPTVRF